MNRSEAHPENYTRFHYEDDDISVGKSNGITRAFNQICSEEGVQVTSTMDPTDFKTVYYIKNVCDRHVQIFYDDTFELLEPGDTFTLKVQNFGRHTARPYIVKVLAQ